jgi:transposase
MSIRALQQIGHAKHGSSGFDAPSRVSRLLSLGVRYHVGSEVSEVVQVSVGEDTYILEDGVPSMTTTGTLYLALELGWDKWLLACATQAAQKPRFRALPARDLGRLQQEIAKAKQRFGLPADAPVYTCYEAGRDGFWLHRALTSRGIHNVVVDSGAIEVNRRRKRAKTDPIDAGKLLKLLCRYHGGERKVWSVVNVPTAADEDRRQLHRGLKDLQRQQTECSNRIKGLLASQGLEAPVDANFRTTLAQLRDWAGQPVPAGLRERVLQEFAVWEALHRQVRDAANEQERRLREEQEPYLDQVRRLLGLKAVGVRSAWILVTELFAWRDIKNGKELGALVGLTPTPYDRGQSEREQGISKAGTKHVRGLLVELAWRWRRWQPGSALSLWYERRFGSGNKRARKVGIVALARKLLIALWRYLRHGEVPEGAAEKDWRLRVSSTARRHAHAAAALG